MSTTDVSVKSVWGVSALVPAHKSERGREKERWGNVVWVKGVWKLSLSLQYTALLAAMPCYTTSNWSQISAQPVSEACTETVRGMWTFGLAPVYKAWGSTRPGCCHIFISTPQKQTVHERIHLCYANSHREPSCYVW